MWIRIQRIYQDGNSEFHKLFLLIKVLFSAFSSAETASRKFGNKNCRTTLYTPGQVASSVGAVTQRRIFLLLRPTYMIWHYLTNRKLPLRCDRNMNEVFSTRKIPSGNARGSRYFPR